MAMMHLSILLVLLLIHGNAANKIKSETVLDDFGQGEIVDTDDIPQDLEDISHTIEKRTKELTDSSLANALRGYDIVNGEPFNVLDGVNVDPGMKKQIFYRGTGDNVQIAKVTNCEAKMQTEIVTTVDQFRKVTGDTSVKGRGFGFERKGKVTVGKPGVASITADFEVSANVGFSNSDSSHKVASYLTESKGAIAMSSTSCYIDEVHISEFAFPPFTNAFKGALRMMDQATPEMRIQAFKRFVTAFGTHYAEKTVLGARLMTTKFLTKKARLDFTRDQMTKCTSKSTGINFFGIKFGSSSKQCSSSDTAKFGSNSEYVAQTVVHSYGSTPASALDDWAKKDFDPLPITRELVPINSLFDDWTLREQDLTIDGARLREWFNPLYHDYCNVMGIRCGAAIEKGCGFTDQCPLNAYCHDQNKTEGTTICFVKDHCVFRPGYPKFLHGRELRIPQWWDRREGDPEKLKSDCIKVCMELRHSEERVNALSVSNDGRRCVCHNWAYPELKPREGFLTCHIGLLDSSIMDHYPPSSLLAKKIY